MGGSLAAACRRKFPRARILGITRSPSALLQAKKRRWIHEGFRDLASGVKNADLVILCTPVDTLLPLMKALDRHVKKGTLVTDVGSVKGEILRRVQRKQWRRIQYIGAHPVVGSHVRGFLAAHPGLYDRGLIFLIRNQKVGRAQFESVRNFWKKISPRVIEVSPETHDQIVSQVSHLPHAVAVSLVLACDPKWLRFASSGFADTTRVAQGHPSLWAPIFLLNRKSVMASLARFEKEIGRFKRALRRRRGGHLTKFLAEAAQKRGQISF